MKTILSLVFAAGALSAQYVTILGSDYPANSRGQLNLKPSIQSGVGAPSGACTSIYDLYLRTSDNTLYGCASSTWALLTVSTTITGTANQITASASTGAVTLSLPSTITGLTSVTSTGFTGALTGNASTATALQTARTIAGVSFNGTANISLASTGLIDTADLVRGAASLSTAGAIPYVTSAGVLGQDAGLNWDATNNRILSGVETGSTNASTRLALVGDTNAYTMAFKASGSGTNFYVGVDTGAVGLNFSNNAGTNLIRIVNTNGNFLLGTITDGNFKLDVGNSGSSGTARFYDQTVATGSTKVVVRAGAGQSGNLQEWQNNAGGVRASITDAGLLTLHNSSFAKIRLEPASGNAITLAGSTIAWSSTSDTGGAVDVAIERASAGLLQIVTQSAGVLRDLQVRTLFSATSTPASASASGTTGQWAWDSNYIYVATGTNTWKRVAIATW